MTQKEIDLLMAWLVNEDLRLDEELQNYQQRIRFRKTDINDCLELALLKCKAESFYDFSLTIIRLLNLDRREIHNTAKINGLF